MSELDTVVEAIDLETGKLYDLIQLQNETIPIEVSYQMDALGNLIKSPIDGALQVVDEQTFEIMKGAQYGGVQIYDALRVGLDTIGAVAKVVEDDVIRYVDMASGDATYLTYQGSDYVTSEVSKAIETVKSTTVEGSNIINQFIEFSFKGIAEAFYLANQYLAERLEDLLLIPVYALFQMLERLLPDGRE